MASPYESPDRARTDLRQGDLVLLGGERFVAVSRSCDLERDDPTHAVIAPLREARSVQELRGWELRSVPVAWAAENVVADLTALRSVDKSELPHTAEAVCATGADARAFAHDVGQAFSEASHPDGITRTFDPLWDALSSKPYRPDKPAGGLVDAILDIRYVPTPDQGPRADDAEREVELIFVLDEMHSVDQSVNEEARALAEKRGSTGNAIADTREAWVKTTPASPERTLALATLCHQLALMCVPQPPVRHVTPVVVSSDEYTYGEYRDSDALRVDRLSSGT